MNSGMTDHEAVNLMAQLIATTNGWDELSIETWKRKLMQLGDKHAASRAVRLLADTWTYGIRPTWGKLMEAYSPAPDPDRWRALPAARDAMSAKQYLARLAECAEHDGQAASELADWKRAISTSNVWAEAIPGLADAVWNLP